MQTTEVTRNKSLDPASFLLSVVYCRRLNLKGGNKKRGNRKGCPVFEIDLARGVG
jgi:hypothetical protein